MKGLINNLVESILRYETSKRWQRRFNRDMISRVSHLNLRREARTLAKLVTGLEKEIEEFQENQSTLIRRTQSLEDEIDRLEKIIEDHKTNVKQRIAALQEDNESLNEVQHNGRRTHSSRS
jgi:chromosome segregation ATPase